MRRHLVLSLSLFLTLSGCAGSTADLASTPVLQTEPLVTVPYAPQIYVHPAGYAERPLTAVFLPFRMEQAMENSSHYGREIARFFHQTWLSEKLFPVMEFVEGAKVQGQQGSFGQAQAVAIARAKGADLAITGRVTRFLAGGGAGKSDMAIRLEIYDAASSQLVWSMAFSGAMENEFTQDYLLFLKRSNLPADPAYAITASIARNLARPMRSWLHPTPAQLAKAQKRQREAAGNQTVDSLLAPGAPADCLDCQDYQHGSTGRVPVQPAVQSSDQQSLL